MAAARELLAALAGATEPEAWERAWMLAEAILDDPRSVLAKGVLNGGPFAMRRAEELAEMVLADHDENFANADRPSGEGDHRAPSLSTASRSSPLR